MTEPTLPVPLRWRSKKTDSVSHRSFYTRSIGMHDQTTITVAGALSTAIRVLVARYPGANANRIGRALVSLGLQQVNADCRQLDNGLRKLNRSCLIRRGQAQ